MKRYTISPLRDTANGEWGNFLEYEFNAPNINGFPFAVYDNEIGGICLAHILRKTPATVKEEILKLIGETYGECVIPMGKGMYQSMINATSLSVGTPIVVDSVSFNESYEMYFLNWVYGKMNKYIGEITRLYTQFKKITKITLAELTADIAFEQFVKNFSRSTITPKTETKTYDIDEDRTKNIEESGSSQNTGDSVDKVADTPEVIPNLSQDESIQQFISRLSKVDTNSELVSLLNRDENNNFNKTGTITTETRKIVNFFDELNKLKLNLFDIIERFVCDIAITFNLG